MDLSRLKRADLVARVESLEAELAKLSADRGSVADCIRSMVAGRVLDADDAARLAVALNLADILDGGSVHLASAGIAKQVLSIIGELAVEDEQASNPLAAVLTLAKSG